MRSPYTTARGRVLRDPELEPRGRAIAPPARGPWRSQLFQSPIPAAGAIAQVCDGISDLDWHPSGLFLGYAGQGQPWEPTASLPAVVGDMTWQISGLHYGAPYLRRFQLASFRQIVLDVAAMDDVRVQILGGNMGPVAPGAPLRAIAVATERIVGNTQPDRVSFAARLAAGTFAVPPGARSVYSAAAVPSWAWLSFDPVSGALLASADVLGLGLEVPIRGSHWRHAEGVAVDLVWTVQL